MITSEAYSWITILMCIGLFQLSLEDFVIAVRHRAIMNFPIANEGLVSGYMKVFRFAYDGTGAWVLKILTLMCALTCIGLVIAGLNPRFVLMVIFFFHLLSYPRWRHFVSSDSPLFRVILTVLLLYYFLPDSPVITEAGLLFLSTYLVLIYHLTGLQKLKSRLWRNGQAIENFMNRFPFWRMVSPVPKKSKWFIRTASWGVMLFELCFFIGLFWPQAAPVFLMAGLLFHGVLSVTVGINHFLWTFIAVYPAYNHMSGKVLETLSHFADIYAGL
ncbi:MAG: hypothetical protein HEP71_12165 [Roseivirga sp.]|nr:hypothetical protein [Roseivirga sp.]